MDEVITSPSRQQTDMTAGAHMHFDPSAGLSFAAAHGSESFKDGITKFSVAANMEPPAVTAPQTQRGEGIGTGMGGRE